MLRPPTFILFAFYFFPPFFRERESSVCVCESVAYGNVACIGLRDGDDVRAAMRDGQDQPRFQAEQVLLLLLLLLLRVVVGAEGIDSVGYTGHTVALKHELIDSLAAIVWVAQRLCHDNWVVHPPRPSRVDV